MGPVRGGEDEWGVIFFTAKFWQKTAMTSKPVLGRALVTKEHCCRFPSNVLAMKSSDVLVCPKLPVYSAIKVDMEDSNRPNRTDQKANVCPEWEVG